MGRRDYPQHFCRGIMNIFQRVRDVRIEIEIISLLENVVRFLECYHQLTFEHMNKFLSGKAGHYIRGI